MIKHDRSGLSQVQRNLLARGETLGQADNDRPRDPFEAGARALIAAVILQAVEDARGKGAVAEEARLFLVSGECADLLTALGVEAQQFQQAIKKLPVGWRRTAFTRARLKARGGRHFGEKRTALTCPQCGQSKTVRYSTAKPKYCSQTCLTQAKLSKQK
jgi:hypothetical protein